MLNSAKLRAWATPLTIGSFILSALTGIILFFHFRFAYAKVFHEWLSWLAVIGVVFHVVGCWRPFVHHFSKHSGRAIMGVFAVLIALSFVPSSGPPKRPPMPPNRLAGLLVRTPFATVANVAAHQPDELIEELKQKGIVVERQEQTIKDIAEANGRQDIEILDLIF